jgi:hypothetical protein
MGNITIIIIAVLFCTNSIICLWVGHHITARMLNKPSAFTHPKKLKITTPNGSPVSRDEDVAVIPDWSDS